MKNDNRFKNPSELTNYLLSGNANLRYTLEERLTRLTELVYSLQDQVNNINNHLNLKGGNNGQSGTDCGHC